MQLVLIHLASAMVLLALFNQQVPTSGQQLGQEINLREDPCSLVRCRSGTICRSVNGRAQCQPIRRPPPRAINRRCPTACPQVYEPVCASNGQTYANECELRLAACSGEQITLVERDECSQRQKRPMEVECPRACPAIYRPVCASNGRTYSNECQLAMAVCQGQQITKIGEGECGKQSSSGWGQNCQQLCTADYEPVCGSDGRTYSNQCNLDMASCNGRDVRKVSEGQCQGVYQRQD